MPIVTEVLRAGIQTQVSLQSHGVTCTIMEVAEPTMEGQRRHLGQRFGLGRTLELGLVR